MRREGVAVERALNKAITVHGTHGATVERNVVYDVRGAGIYIEDGNELRNTIAHNAILCPSLSHKSQIGRLTPAEPPTGRTATGHRCALKGVPSHSDSDYDEQSGIYLLSPTNDVIGNHVVGMENAFYVNHQGGRSYGIGAAYGRVCILSSPFGTVSGNVFHNNAGFGFYVNLAYPTKVKTDASGFVSDWRSCLPWDMETGADNAAPFTVANHVEYFNDFSSGAYDLGDIAFENFTAGFNNKGLYFKTYRRGAASAPLCTNCSFVRNGIAMNGPGGSALVEFKHSRIVVAPGGRPAVEVNHHCARAGELTGGLCGSHYSFMGADFGGASPMFLDGSDGEQSDVLIFTDTATLLHTHANIAFDNATAGCAEDADGWLACDPAAELRIVRIYSPDRGALGVRVLDGGGGGGRRRARVLGAVPRDSEDDGRRERVRVHAGVRRQRRRVRVLHLALGVHVRRRGGRSHPHRRRPRADGRRRAARPLHARVLGASAAANVDQSDPLGRRSAHADGDAVRDFVDAPARVHHAVWAAGAADGRVVRLRGLADGARRRRVLRRV